MKGRPLLVRRSAWKRLNKFPLSCVCYSRAENGRSTGAGGQGQPGAAVTRRAEGARWVQESILLRRNHERCAFTKLHRIGIAGLPSLPMCHLTRPPLSHLQLWENWLGRRKHTYTLIGRPCARFATHTVIPSSVHRVPRAGFRSEAYILADKSKSRREPALCALKS